jgi:CBS domain-containing protein
MATVRELLAGKGTYVHMVPPTATVLEAIHTMNDRRVGAVVVGRDGVLDGIFTERDVLRRVVAEQRDVSSLSVSEVMTVDVLCCAPETTVEEASRIMRDERVRHLPVCDAHGRVVGLISIGDVNAFHANVQDATIQLLNDYVTAR